MCFRAAWRQQCSVPWQPVIRSFLLCTDDRQWSSRLVSGTRMWLVLTGRNHSSTSFKRRTRPNGRLRRGSSGVVPLRRQVAPFGRCVCDYWPSLMSPSPVSLLIKASWSKVEVRLPTRVLLAVCHPSRCPQTHSVLRHVICVSLGDINAHLETELSRLPHQLSEQAGAAESYQEVRLRESGRVSAISGGSP